jgi:hypothetical protein
MARYWYGVQLSFPKLVPKLLEGTMGCVNKRDKIMVCVKVITRNQNFYSQTSL